MFLATFGILQFCSSIQSEQWSLQFQIESKNYKIKIVSIVMFLDYQLMVVTLVRNRSYNANTNYYQLEMT